MPSQTRILIIGAGVVGLSSAYYLHRAGHDVTIVDRHPEVASETSFGNGGQLSYSYVAPLAGPGVISKLPRWLTQRDSPVRFQPRMSTAQWRWCFQFLSACTRERSALTTRTLLPLSFLSRTLMHELIAAEPTLDFDFVRSGKLVLHRDAHAMQSAKTLMAFQHTLGCRQQALSAQACVDIEPSLAHVKPHLAGGIHTPSEDTADCRLFCLGLERVLRARGVRFMMHSPVELLRSEQGRQTGRDAQGMPRVQAFSDGEPLAADHIVVASGTGVAPLLKPLGMHVPVYPLKGYSLTYDLPREWIPPHVSVTDFSRKIVYARFAGQPDKGRQERLRVAGIADIGGYSSAADPHRLQTLHREATLLFPELSDSPGVSEWAGLRPATPHGTPLVGPTRYRNLWLNVGHGGLGFTLATGSAALLADWLSASAGLELRHTFAPSA